MWIKPLLEDRVYFNQIYYENLGKNKEYTQKPHKD